MRQRWLGWLLVVLLCGTLLPAVTDESRPDRPAVTVSFVEAADPGAALPSSAPALRPAP